MSRWIEQLKGAAIFALMFLCAPFMAAGLVFKHFQQKPIVERLRRDRVDDLRVEGGDLVIKRAGQIERMPLAELSSGAWTIVDYGGAFADANECGLLFDFEREGGEPRRLALEYYEHRHHEQLIRPLQARGLLPDQALQEGLTGSFYVAMVTMLMAGGVLVGLVIAAIWSGWLR